MGKGYLIDTNTVIDYLDNKLPEANSILIDENTPRISVITRMELLGWTLATKEQLQVLEQFINASVVYDLTEPIIVRAIELRQSNKIKLPDAIIAATSLVHDLTLITRNIGDFKNIDELNLMNPHSIDHH